MTRTTFQPTWSPDGQYIAYEQLDTFEVQGTTTAGTTTTILEDTTKNFTTLGVAVGMTVDVAGAWGRSPRSAPRRSRCRLPSPR